MKIEEIGIKIACDCAGCANLADYALKRNDKQKTGGFFICRNCLKELKKAVLNFDKKGEKSGGKRD